MVLLAFIGLIALLILAKKFFDAIGKCFDALSHDLTHRAISKSITERKLLASIKKIEEKINTIKGNGTDQEYWGKDQINIDDLCK